MTCAQSTVASCASWESDCTQEPLNVVIHRRLAVDPIRSTAPSSLAAMYPVLALQVGGHAASRASVVGRALCPSPSRSPFHCRHAVQNKPEVRMPFGVPRPVEIVIGVVAHAESTHDRLGPLV